MLKNCQDIEKKVLCRLQMTFQQCYQVVDLEIQREGNKPWGLRIVGGADVATVMKVLQGSHLCFIFLTRKTERNYPGGEGSWDRHPGTQGRPEGGGRLGGGARGADHHDDPPPGLSPDELITKERLNDHL